MPSSTSIRFAVLTLAVVVSAGSLFAYLWQLSEPGAQALVRRCLAGVSTGRLPRFLHRVAAAPVSKAVRVGDCVRPVGPGLTAWFLIGAGGLIGLSLLLYAITPWWIIHGGRAHRRRPLTSMDPDQRQALITFVDQQSSEDQARKIWPASPVSFFVDEQAVLTTGGQAFGHRRRPCIRLDRGLLIKFPKNGALVADVVFHELAHLRNQDNGLTYLTIAAWRALLALIPIGCVAVRVTSGAWPAAPDPGIYLAMAALVTLVMLSKAAVLRSRELHADATAAFYRRDATLRTVLGADQGSRAPWWRRALRNDARTRDRAATLRAPERLYRADTVAMFSAGVAIAVIVSDVTIAVFGVILTSASGSSLKSDLTGNHPLFLLLATCGPAALLAALVIVGLSFAMTWRLHYRSGVDGTAMPVTRLAVAMAAGILVGSPLGLNDAVAGTWAALDTSVTRDLIITAMSLGLLMITLTVMTHWVSECAAVWSADGRRPSRTVRAAATLLGGFGLTPVLYAWNVTHELALSDQLVRGPDGSLERRYIGHWPDVTALFTHYTPIGVFDTVPGFALLLALPCLLVAAAGLRRAGVADPRRGAVTERPRVPLGAVTLAGLVGTVCASALVLVLMLAVRADIGGTVIEHAGGFGLLYLTRAAEAVIAVCAATAAALVARRTPKTRLTSAVLTALLTSTGAALVVPQLLYIGQLGWPHPRVNPVDNHVLFGFVGNLGAGRPVILAIAVVTATRGLSWAVAALRRARIAIPAVALPAPVLAAPVPSAPVLAAVAQRGVVRVAASRLLVVYSVVLLLAGLSFAAYYWVTLGLTFR